MSNFNEAAKGCRCSISSGMLSKFLVRSAESSDISVSLNREVNRLGRGCSSCIYRSRVRS